MIINQQSLAVLNTAFSTAFARGLGQAASLYKKVAFTVPSTTAQNQYGWLGKVPGMREWVGERVVNGLSQNAYTVTNKDYEGTVGVASNDIEDDQYGVYSPMFEELGASASRLPDELVFGLLAKGAVTNCYDGQYFFDTDHPVLDKSGVEKSVSNVFGGGTGAAWYLMDLSRTVKPLLFQNRKNPTLVRMDKADAANVFFQKKYIYGVDSRCNAGFGLWQLAVMSKEPLTVQSYEAAKLQLEGMKGDHGVPLALKTSAIVVPSSLEGAALRAVKATTVAEGGVALDNIWTGSSEVIVAPYL